MSGMDLGNIGPGDSVDIKVDVQLGQLLKLSYTQAPGADETKLSLEPRGDALFREVSHDREELENGYTRHVIIFQVERIGV